MNTFAGLCTGISFGLLAINPLAATAVFILAAMLIAGGHA